MGLGNGSYGRADAGYFLKMFYECVCGHAYTTAYIWKSVDNFAELVFSFHLGSGTQVIRPAWQMPLPAQLSIRPKVGFHLGQWDQSSSEMATDRVSSVSSAPIPKTDSAVLRPYPASSGRVCGLRCFSTPALGSSDSCQVHSTKLSGEFRSLVTMNPFSSGKHQLTGILYGARGSPAAPPLRPCIHYTWHRQVPGTQVSTMRPGQPGRLL